jgi:hypothetical protein
MACIGTRAFVIKLAVGIIGIRAIMLADSEMVGKTISQPSWWVLGANSTRWKHQQKLTKSAREGAFCWSRGAW